MHQFHPTSISATALFACPSDPRLETYGGWYVGSYLRYRLRAGLPRFPISYGYFHILKNNKKAWAYARLRPKAGWLVCVVHRQADPAFAAPNLFYESLTLRLGFDGSVRTVFIEQEEHTFDNWKVLTDENWEQSRWLRR